MRCGMRYEEKGNSWHTYSQGPEGSLTLHRHTYTHTHCLDISTKHDAPLLHIHSDIHFITPKKCRRMPCHAKVSMCTKWWRISMTLQAGRVKDACDPQRLGLTVLWSLGGEQYQERRTTVFTRYQRLSDESQLPVSSKC